MPERSRLITAERTRLIAPARPIDVGQRSANIGLERALRALGLVALLVPLGLLAFVLVDLLRQGWSSIPHRIDALLKSIPYAFWLMVLVTPLALATACGLAFARLSPSRAVVRFCGLVERTFASLASMPTLIFGLLGLAVFGPRANDEARFGSAVAVLALLVFPKVCAGASTALTEFSANAREAALALGATRMKWFAFELAAPAWPRMTAASIRAVAQILGEAAPLLVLGGFAYADILPVTIVADLLRPGHQADAAGGLLVLLFALFALELVAIRIAAGPRAPTD